MLGEGRSYIFSNPNLATFPGIAIFLTVLGFNLAGDGLRDALDPTLDRAPATHSPGPSVLSGTIEFRDPTRIAGVAVSPRASRSPRTPRANGRAAAPQARRETPARTVDGRRRRAARLLPPDAADPPLRREDRRDVPARQDRRLLPPQPGRRGHLRRPDAPACSRRDYLFTNYREHGYALARGIEPGPGHGRAVRPRRRRLARPRRLDAPVRRREAPDGRLRDRRRPAAAGHRRRAGHRPQGRATTWSSARWATPPPTSAPSTSRSTWPRCGSCRWST